MAMFEAATDAFKPGAKPAGAPEPAKEGDDDIAALKAQLASLQDKIDKMGK